MSIFFRLRVYLRPICFSCDLNIPRLPCTLWTQPPQGKCFWRSDEVCLCDILSELCTDGLMSICGCLAIRHPDSCVEPENGTLRTSFFVSRFFRVTMPYRYSTLDFIAWILPVRRQKPLSALYLSVRTVVRLAALTVMEAILMNMNAEAYQEISSTVCTLWHAITIVNQKSKMRTLIIGKYVRHFT
ncbi:hypothetical protein BDQ17DRAFT_354307 [Cyathus striatus]|nr:hypothetical protein BDQ17DRAFT_354307 [Cyathus striatus]